MNIAETIPEASIYHIFEFSVTRRVPPCGTYRRWDPNPELPAHESRDAGVYVVGVDVKIVWPRQVPAIERHICMAVAGGYVIRVCLVRIHGRA